MATPTTTTAALAALERLSFGVRVDAIADALKHADQAESDALGCALLDLVIPEINAILESPPLDSGPPDPGGRVARFLGRIGDRLTGTERTAAAIRAAEVLVANWPRLPENVHRLVLATDLRVWARAGEAVAARAADGDPDAAEAASSLLATAPWPAFAQVAATLLETEDRAVVRTAEAAIGEMARPLLGEWPSAWVDTPDRSRIFDDAFEPAADAEPSHERTINAIAGAAWAYPSHLCRGPVRSALLILAATREGRVERRISMRVERLLQDGDHPAHAALARSLRRSRAPITRRLAFRLLTEDTIAAAALERVANGGSAADHAAMFELGHLALRPSRARTLATLREPKPAGLAIDGLLPRPAALARLTAPARREVLRLVRTAAIGEDRSRTITETFLGDPSPANRLIAAAGADGRDLPDFSLDAHARVAAHALHRWGRADASLSLRWPPRHADETRVRLLTKLRRSPHAGVRTLAVQELGSSSPWSFESPRSRLLARRWAEAAPEAFAASVRRRLAAGDAGVRVATLMTLRRLGMVGLFEAEVAALVTDAAENDLASGRVLATAVIALGSARSRAAADAVRSAIDSSDDRVRANAVEALASVAANGSPGGTGDAPGTARVELVELKADPHHRVRANAIRVLLRDAGFSRGGRPAQRVYEPAAVEQLRAMLTDTRGAHRLAAAWLAGRVLVGDGRVALGPHWEPLTRALADTARDDAEVTVRRRARSGVRRVLGEMRAAETHAPRAAAGGVA